MKPFRSLVLHQQFGGRRDQADGVATIDKQWIGGKHTSPGDTRDASADPPPPLEYDPYNLDGRAILEDFNTIPQKVQEAVNALRKVHRTTSAPKIIKDDVIQTLEIALVCMANFTNTLSKAKTISHRLQCIAREVLDAKAELKIYPQLRKENQSGDPTCQVLDRGGKNSITFNFESSDITRYTQVSRVHR